MKKNMIVTLCLLALLTYAEQNPSVIDLILTNMAGSPKKDIFKAYHYLFQKSYELNSEQGLQRYKIFKQNLKYIEDVNNQGLSMTLGINQFSDITNEEYIKTHLSSFSLYIETNKSIDYLDQIDREDEEADISFPATDINWKDYLPKDVSNQLSCGCCWAFASVSVIEANYRKVFNDFIGLSEQDLINCNKENNGCKGGDFGLAYNYIIKKGLAYRNAVPYISGYTEESDTCSPTVTRNFVVDKFERGQTKEKLWEFLAKGPVASYIDASSDLFRFYKGGILDPELMKCKVPTHAAHVYAYLNNYNGKKVYSVLNSWGKGWGINGSYYISLGSQNTCMIETGATFPTVKKTSNPVPPEPKPKCLTFYSDCKLKGMTFEVCSSLSSIPANKRQIAGFISGKFEGIEIIPFTNERCIDNSFYTLDHSVSCFAESGLGKLINNIKSVFIKSDIKVTKGCIKVFEDGCLSGAELEICQDSKDLTTLGWHKRIGSVKIGEGVKGFIPYTSQNFYGTYSNFGSDSLGLSDSFYKKIMSIKILK